MKNYNSTTISKNNKLSSHLDELAAIKRRNFLKDWGRGKSMYYAAIEKKQKSLDGTKIVRPAYLVLLFVIVLFGQLVMQKRVDTIRAKAKVKNINTATSNVVK